MISFSFFLFIYLFFYFHSAIFMLSRLATVLQELSGEEGQDGEQQVREHQINFNSQ